MGTLFFFPLLKTQKLFLDKEDALEQCTRREDCLELCFVVSYILEPQVFAYVYIH